MKKEPKFISVTSHPILVIGEKMGRQRAGQDRYALEGNGTGDFVHEAIGERGNIILTNIVNYYYEGNFDKKRHVEEGLQDIIQLVLRYKPRKIITLGGIARDYIANMQRYIFKDIRVVSLPHPSWVNRFKRRNRLTYIKQLSDELDQ